MPSAGYINRGAAVFVGLALVANGPVVRMSLASRQCNPSPHTVRIALHTAFAGVHAGWTPSCLSTGAFAGVHVAYG